MFGDSNCLDSAHLQSGRYWYTSSTHSHPPTITSPSDCFWLLDVLLKYAVEGVVPQYVTASTRPLPPAFLPKRMEGQLTLFINHNERSIFVFTARPSQLMNNLCCFSHLSGSRLHQYSKVVAAPDPSHYHTLPTCPQYVWAIPRPINTTR